MSGWLAWTQLGRLIDSCVLFYLPDLHCLPRYCCNVGSFHMKRAMLDGEGAKEWLMSIDAVVAMQAATAVGKDGVEEIVMRYNENGALYVDGSST